MNKTIKNIFFALAAFASSALASILTIYVSIDGYFPFSLRTIFSFEFLFLSPSPGVSFRLFWGMIIWGLLFFAVFFPGFRKALFRLFSPFKELFKLLGDFCRRHKAVVLFSAVLFVLCYGFEIINPTLSIDEEGSILGGNNFLNWLVTGRLGSAVFKSFFQFHNLLPLFFASFISAALWTISGLLWCAILFFRKSSAKQTDTIALIIFCGLYMSMPTVIAEFMISAIYNIDISLAMIFAAISVYCIMSYVDSGDKANKRDRKYFFGALIPLTFAISIYQSYVPVFITGTIAALICSFFHSTESADESNSESEISGTGFVKWLRTIVPFVLVLLISLASYYALTYISLSITGLQTAAYLDGFVGWGTGESLVSIFRNTLIQIFIHFFSSGYPGSAGVRLTVAALAVLALLCFIHFKGWKKPVMPILCALLGLSPFLLNFALMGFVPLRAMQALPLMMGVAWCLLYHVIRRLTANRAAVVVPCVVAILLIVGQVQTMNKLFYAGHLQYQMDRHIASMVMHDVKKEFGGLPDTPIMFLGVYHQPPNPVVIQTGIIARSFWDFDEMDNSRITSFLRAIGYDIVSSDLSKPEMEHKHRDSMPIWPAEGSIVETLDGIMVRLS